MSKKDWEEWEENGRTYRRYTGKGPHRTYETHPAYGTAVFHRMTGHPGKLFGSNIEEHHSFIGLTICQGERMHDLGRDWIHGGKELVEVWFSPAQFAELLTTMNVGSGVPCTIKHLGVANRMPEIPEDEKSEPQRVVDDFKAKVDEIASVMDEKIAVLTKMLEEKPSINKGDRAEIKQLLEYVQREVHANFPFQVQSFNEAVEKTTVQAKAEIDALVTGVVQAAGIEALRGKAKAVSDGLSERVKAIEAGKKGH